MLGGSLTTVLGVELFHHGDGQYGCRMIELGRKGNQLEVLGRKVFEGTLGKVLEGLPKALPVALVLSGKGIVHKSVVLENGSDGFRGAFPSIERKDFYVQVLTSDGGGCLSIARRDMVNELLEKLWRAGLKVTTLGFGGPVALQVLGQLNSYGEEVIFDGHHFSLSDKKFQSYSYHAGRKADYPIKVAEEPLQEELLVAYAAAFQLLLHDKLSLILADVDQVNDRFAKLLDNNKWKKRALVFLFGLFGLLLFNFAVFSHYNQQNEHLLREVGAQTSSAEQMELLQEQIIKQERILKELNWNGGYNYGFLLNEIGRSMPRALSLLSVGMNDFRTEQEKADHVPNIRIKGTTANLTAVNNWIFVLREKSWVKSAKLLRFQEEQEGDQYQFEILINY